MDIWRIILAIAQVAAAAAQHEIVVFNEVESAPMRIILAVEQVAAAAKHEEVVFNWVESAPMARFHGIGQVFPDALNGHIVVTFDVALLRQDIKELQEGISYRRQRAPAEHRGLYDVLEENLVAGNQELEDDMDFFMTSKRKD
jgi:hypothetical protein